MKKALVLVLCLALPAAAQNNEVKKFVNAAITLYENLEYEKALKQLQKAKLKAQGPDDEAKIGLLEGIVLADMGREEKALTAFKTAFGVDLEAKLPVDVSPKVQAVAEKARANVRKLLAPTLEAQRLEEEKKAAAEQKHAEETARLAAEEKKRQDEEAARNAPPPPLVTVKQESSGPSLRVLSLIPGVIGVAAGGVGTYFLISASNKYHSLVNGTVDASTASDYRSSGPRDATIGYVLVGVGAAGIVAAVTMLILGGSSSSSGAPAVSLVPTPGGAFMSLSFDLGGAR
jgi:tetratricopeptide (TPR) repeat protein